MKLKLKYIAVFGLASFLGLISPQRLVSAPIKISYDGQSYKYSGVAVKYQLNGKEIKAKHPGLIIDGISLASIDEIFVKTGIGATYQYDEVNESLFIKQGKNEILMSLTSNEAWVNNEVKQVSLKPRFISFSGGKKLLYVPARFLSSALGLSYNWDSSQGVASISGELPKKKKVKKKIVVKKKEKKEKKEVEKKEVEKKEVEKKEVEKREVEKREVEKKEKKLKEERNEASAALKDVIFFAEDNKLNNSLKPGRFIDNILMAPADSLFLNDIVEGGYYYNKTKKELILEFDQNKVILKLDSKTGKLGKKKIKLKKAPILFKYEFSNDEVILIPIKDIAKLFGWKIHTDNSICKISLPSSKDEASVLIGSTNDSELVNPPVSDSVTEGTENLESHNSVEDDKKKEGKEGESNQTKKEDETLSSNKVAEGNNFSFATSNVNYLKNQGISTLTGAMSASPSKLLDVVQIETLEHGKFDTYSIISDNGFGKVESSFLDKKLTLSLDEMVTDRQDKIFFKAGGMADYVRIHPDDSFVSAVTNGNKKRLILDFFLTEKAYYYDLSIDESGKILTVKIFRNTITQIEGKNEKNNFIVTLKGTSDFSLDSIIRRDNELLEFDVTDIGDSVGGSDFINTDKSSGLKSFSYQVNGSQIKLNILKDKSYGYTLKKKDKSVSIIISKLENSSFPVYIPLPKGFKASNISDEDEYLDNKIKLYFHKNLGSFFETNPIIVNSKEINDYIVSEDGKGNTVISIFTNGMKAYQLTKGKGFVGVKLGKATDFYKKVVVIDPGHGGHDTGARSLDKKHNEKDVVLNVGYTYFKEFLDDPDMKVYWTRKGDTFMTLDDRAQFAERIGADAFVSIHANWAQNKKAEGSEIYYSIRNNAIQSSGLSSYILAEEILTNYTSALKMRNRGVRSNVFYVTNMNTVPAVLLELGFLSNSKDLGKLVSDDKQIQMAEVIYQSIKTIFEEYPTGR